MDGNLGSAQFTIQLGGVQEFLAGLERVRSAAQRTAQQTQEALNGQSVSLKSEQAIAARIARLQEERSALDINSRAYRDYGRQIAAAERELRGRSAGIAQSLAGLLPGAGGAAAGQLVAGAGVAAVATGVAAMGAATAAGVQSFASYEAALKQVGALSGANEVQLQQLGQAFLETARTSGIGKTELAGLASELARTGFSADQIIKSLQSVVTVAQATGEGVQTAAAVVAQAMQLWKIPAEQAGRVGDILAKSANVSAASLSSLAETLKYVGPAAVNAGQSFEDVVAMTSALANGGIKGSMAGTTLVAVLTRLQTASAGATTGMDDFVRGNPKRVQAFQMLETAVRNADGTMRPLLDVLPELKKALADLSAPERDQMIVNLFGEEGGRGFLALVNQSSESLQKMRAEIRNSAGESEALRKKQEGLALELNRAGQAWEGLIQSLGNVAEAQGLAVFLRVLSDILDQLSGALSFTADRMRDLNKAFAGLPSWARPLVGAAIGGAMGGAPGAIAGAKLASEAKTGEEQLQAELKNARDQLEKERAARLKSAKEGTATATASQSGTQKEIDLVRKQAEAETAAWGRYEAAKAQASATQKTALDRFAAIALQEGRSVEKVLAERAKAATTADSRRELESLLTLFPNLAAATGHAADRQREFNAALAEARKAASAVDRRSVEAIAAGVGSRQQELAVMQRLAEQDGTIGAQAKARVQTLEKELEKQQALLQVRQQVAAAELTLGEAQQRVVTGRLQSFERLTDLYRQQVSLGAQIAAEQGGLRTDALQARLAELEKTGQGNSGAALAIRQEVLREEQAIAEQKNAAERRSLQYEALKLGYSQQRERIEAQIAANQAQAALIQARLDQQSSGAAPGSDQARLDALKVQTAAEGLRLAQQRLGMLGQEQQAERQNLALQRELLEVQQQRGQAGRNRQGAALGVSLEPDPGLSLRPGESTGVLLRPDPSLVQELSSAYEQSSRGVVDQLVSLLGETGNQSRLLEAIASRETNITINVDSAGGVNAVAGMG